GADDHVVAEREILRFAVGGEVQHGGLVRRGLAHRHRLVPVAVVAGGQPEAREQRLDGLDRLVLADGAGAAARELVRGQYLHVARQVCRRDRGLEVVGLVDDAGRRRGGAGVGGRAAFWLAGVQRQGGEEAGEERGWTWHRAVPEAGKARC